MNFLDNPPNEEKLLLKKIEDTEEKNKFLSNMLAQLVNGNELLSEKLEDKVK